MNNEFIWDIEVYKNYLLIGLMNIYTKEKYSFEVFDNKDYSINEFHDFLNFINSNTNVIGFKSIDYDYSVVHKIIEEELWNLNTHVFLEKVYNISQEVIANQRSYIYPNKWYFQNTDLYKIWHFNNNARRMSLKALEIELDLPIVEDLPYRFDKVLNFQMKEKVKNYNQNADLPATYQLFLLTIGETENPLYKGEDKLEMRRMLGNLYNININNQPDVGIGREIFIKKIQEKLGLKRSEVRKMKTNRPYVRLKDCTPDINFEYKLFNIGKDIFLNKTQFISHSNIEDESGKASAIYTIYDRGNYISIPVYSDETSDMLNQKYKNENLRINKAKANAKKGFTILFNNQIKLDYGLGGLHGCIEPGIVKSNKNYVVIDLDVAGYYPNYAIENKIEPEHLKGIFTEIYENDIVEPRNKIKPLLRTETNSEKRAEMSVITKGLKFAGNGAYGLSKDIYSPLYDPKYTYSVTIGGQMYITLLIDLVNSHIKDLYLIQANTDGITIKVKRSDEQLVNDVCKMWEAITNLVLEKEVYEAMYIRDVNNYIALWEEKKEVNKEKWIELKEKRLAKCTKTDGKYYIQKVKCKGAYEIWKEIHKDSSMKIIRMAVFDYFMYDIPISETIEKNKNNIYLYRKRYKATHGFKMYTKFILDGEVHKEVFGKNLRYYIGLKGDPLYKEKDGRITSIEKGYKIIPFNIYFDAEDYQIDTKYYIIEANKLKDALLPKLTLFNSISYEM
jgi:hypothetical protein